MRERESVREREGDTCACERERESCACVREGLTFIVGL